MKFKTLLIELLQATGFCAVLTFLFAILSFDSGRQIIKATSIAVMFGGIPAMLAKRFIVDFIKEIKAAS